MEWFFAIKTVHYAEYKQLCFDLNYVVQTVFYYLNWHKVAQTANTGNPVWIRTKWYSKQAAISKWIEILCRRRKTIIHCVERYWTMTHMCDSMSRFLSAVLWQWFVLRDIKSASISTAFLFEPWRLPAVYTYTWPLRLFPQSIWDNLLPFLKSPLHCSQSLCWDPEDLH